MNQSMNISSNGEATGVRSYSVGIRYAYIRKVSSQKEDKASRKYLFIRIQTI